MENTPPGTYTYVRAVGRRDTFCWLGAVRRVDHMKAEIITEGETQAYGVRLYFSDGNGIRFIITPRDYKIVCIDALGITRALATYGELSFGYPNGYTDGRTCITILSATSNTVEFDKYKDLPYSPSPIISIDEILAAQELIGKTLSEMNGDMWVNIMCLLRAVENNGAGL